MLTGVHCSSQPCIVCLFSAPCSGSLASIPNSRRAPRCSRVVSDSAEPNSDGVTKSPCSAATCITKLLRNSSPTSGSNTTAVAKNASDQSRVAVSLSTFSRVFCQIGSSCQVLMWAWPSKPSISSSRSRL